MFAGTSTSSTGDRMYVEIQQMWCGPVDYSRCEVRQRRKLGCRPWAAWHVECEDGSSRRNAGRADLADRRREWAVQDSVVPVHSEPYKPGPRFCTRYVPGHEASVIISVRMIIIVINIITNNKQLLNNDRSKLMLKCHCCQILVTKNCSVIAFVLYWIRTERIGQVL